MGTFIIFMIIRDTFIAATRIGFYLLGLGCNIVEALLQKRAEGNAAVNSTDLH